MSHKRRLATIGAVGRRGNQRRRQDGCAEWLACGRHEVAVRVVEVGNRIVDLGRDTAAGSAHFDTVQPGTRMREVERVRVGRPLLARRPAIVEQTRQRRRRARRRSELDERRNRGVRLAVHVGCQRHVADAEGLVSELVVRQLVVTRQGQSRHWALGGECAAYCNRSGDLRRGGKPVGVGMKVRISGEISDGIAVDIALADRSVVSGDPRVVPPDARTRDCQWLSSCARKRRSVQLVERCPTHIELRVGDAQAGSCVEQPALVEHAIRRVDVDPIPVGVRRQRCRQHWARVRDEDGMTGGQPRIVLQAGKGRTQVRAQGLQAAAVDLDSAVHDLDDVAIIGRQVTIHGQRPVQEIAKRHVGPGRGDGGDPRQVVRRLAVEHDRVEPVPLSVVALNDASRAADLEIGLDTAQIDGRVAQCRRRR